MMEEVVAVVGERILVEAMEVYPLRDSEAEFW